MSAAAYVSGGSNVEPERHLRVASQSLRQLYPSARFSRCYRNAAVGFEGADFVNFVVELPATGSVAELKARLEAIEAQCGRPAAAPRWKPRTMDLDILLFSDLIGEYDGVRLPRPSLLDWDFMLGPLAELAPTLLHPLKQRTMQELWQDFDRSAHPLTAVPLDLNRD